jgi:hypothetical protein
MPPRGARLVASASGALGLMSGLLCAAAGTVNLAAVAAAADEHLGLAAGNAAPSAADTIGSDCKIVECPVKFIGVFRPLQGLHFTPERLSAPAIKVRFLRFLYPFRFASE